MPSDPDQPLPESETPSSPGEEKDAPLKEILFYGIGNVESGLANQFFGLLNNLMIVALGMNPILLGLILSIKTIWDGITDPIMAYITDNARTRWGRRRPFILVGGIARVLLLLAIFAFFPREGYIKANSEYAAEKIATEQAAANPQTPEARIDVAEGDANAVAPTPEAPKPKPPKPGMIEQIKTGYQVFLSADNAYHKHVTIYLLVACLLFALFSTIISVRYYALGIELAPSYDGRTRVVTYRSAVDKLTALVGPWILPFCFLPIFTNVIDGMFWYAVFVVVIGAPSVVLMVMNTKERLAITAAREGKGPGIFKSIWLTAKNVHFLKILCLFQLIGYANGIFAQLGFFLTVYWVYAGDPLAGSTLGAYAGTLGIVLALASLPLINLACKKLQKHRALRFAMIWMSIGSALNWFLINPEHPYWQLALPFFFSIGISSVYTILPTMMADVTDLDELENGTRREGMFGAVMAFLMKFTGTMQPLLAGAVLVWSGFDASLGQHQDPATITKMRLMYSAAPAILILSTLILLWRYPITRQYMEVVKAKLLINRAALATKEG